MSPRPVRLGWHAVASLGPQETESAGAVEPLCRRTRACTCFAAPTARALLTGRDSCHHVACSSTDICHAKQFVYTYIYMCIHIYRHTCLHMSAHMYIYTSIYIHEYTFRMMTCLYIWKINNMYIHTDMSAHVYAYIQNYTYV